MALTIKFENIFQKSALSKYLLRVYQKHKYYGDLPLKLMDFCELVIPQNL